MPGLTSIISSGASPWAGYAPREPMRLLMQLIERLCAANKSDSCIVSIPKLQELLHAWYGLKRCRRTVIYHLKRLRRENLITRQTRFKFVNGRLEIKGRNRYRIAYRHWQRLAAAAKQAIRLLPMAATPARRETVQKIASGLQILYRTVVPEGVIQRR